MRVVTSDGKGNILSDEYTGTLDTEKAELIASYKARASGLLEAEVPVFKQTNAALGLYTTAEKNAIKAIVSAFIAKVDAFETAVNAVKSFDELKAVEFDI